MDTYEKKLALAKEALDSGSYDKETIEYIFPELAESEDERMKKIISDILLIDSDEIREILDANNVLMQDIDAWLEKQGGNHIVGNNEMVKPADKVKPKFKVKYAGSEYNVLEVRDIAGVTFYGIEDKPKHIDYVLPNNCEIVSEQTHAWSEEDERIKKEIVKFIVTTPKERNNHKKWIAWLEKQSTDIFSFPKEQQVFMKKYVSLDKITLIKLLAERDANNAEIIESFENQGDQKLIKEHNVCDFCEDRYGCVNPCPVKLIEQKPTDKIKPKFKIGDWVIGRATSNEPRQISEITDQCYKSTYGGQYGFSFEDEMHLWTIQDAKDGDVLAYNDGSLTIFSYRLSGLDAGLYMAHVLLTDKIKSRQTCAIANVHPATKEQRDFLFQKMHEAGYRWNPDTLTLEKVEKPSTIKFEEEPVFDGMVYEYIKSKEEAGITGKELTAYRQGLEDMWNKLKKINRL